MMMRAVIIIGGKKDWLTMEQEGLRQIDRIIIGTFSNDWKCGGKGGATTKVAYSMLSVLEHHPRYTATG